MKKYGVFASYSHEDADLVSPIVSMMSSMRDDLVFQDRKDLKPGKLWEEQLMSALNEVKIVVVFWCCHSAKSEYVKKEYELAISKSKDVLPLLLDDSELPKNLLAYQNIDFRKAAYHNTERFDFHTEMEREANKRKQWQAPSSVSNKLNYHPKRKKNIIKFICYLLAVIILITFPFLKFHSQTLTNVQSYFKIALLTIFSSVVLLFIILIFWLKGDNKKREESIVDYSNDPEYLAERIRRLRGTLEYGEIDYFVFIASCLASKIPRYKQSK